MSAGLRLRALAAAVFLILVSGPAVAGFAPKVAAGSTGRGAVVTLNGRTAVRFLASNGALSAAERASITAERLKLLAAAGVSPASINAKGDKRQARIYAGESLICVATALDARAARSTALGLATSWAENIRRLLAMPALILSDRSVTVPLGENRRIEVGGAATGPITVLPTSADIATATVGAEGRNIVIMGQAVGVTMIEVMVEGEKAVIDVFVKEYAGSCPDTSFGEVTGSPCPASLVKYAAIQAVLRSAILEPGTTIRVERVTGCENALGQGLNREAKVDVGISGMGYIACGKQVTVQVHNSAMPREATTQLFYSNSPERLTKYQTLYMGKLDFDKSTRVLYHHQNAMGKRAHLVLEIINPSSLPASFRVSRSAAGPIVDTVLVGYLASLGFLKDEFYNASVMERVPPKSKLVVVSDMLGHLETSSGILQIRQTDGQGAYVRIAALPPGLEDVVAGSVSPASDAPDMGISEHIYPSPVKTVDASYVVGQRWAFISIGKHAIGSNNAQKKLDGNYGVTYVINVKVENPTPITKKVVVMFEPSAGLASGVFIIDGEFVSTKYARPPSEVTLASYQLKPGEARKVTITTVPVAGSNYPANLVVRS